MNKIKSTIEGSIAVKRAVLADTELQARVARAAELMITALKADRKVLFCGNGGSAADAQHLSCELSGRFYLDRPGLYAEALHVNTSALTAIGNDFDFSEIYARQLEGMGKKGDVLFALSTSGNSTNIVKAIVQARQLGMHIVGFTGATGGAIKDLVDVLINIPSTDTPRIQESHIMLGHAICEIVEAKMFA